MPLSYFLEAVDRLNKMPKSMADVWGMFLFKKILQNPKWKIIYLSNDKRVGFKGS